jgi:hypothetical protein
VALSASVLSAAIRAGILAEPSIGGIDGTALTKLCDAIASAVVTHITGAAVVLPALLVAPPGGGPVTGTGVIT